MDKKLSASVKLCPLTRIRGSSDPHQGLPWPCWGLCSQTHYKLTHCALAMVWPLLFSPLANPGSASVPFITRYNCWYDCSLSAVPFLLKSSRRCNINSWQFKSLRFCLQAKKLQIRGCSSVYMSWVVGTSGELFWKRWGKIYSPSLTTSPRLLKRIRRTTKSGEHAELFALYGGRNGHK